MRLAHFLALAALAFLAQPTFGQPSLLNQVEQGLPGPGGSPAASGYLGAELDDEAESGKGVRVTKIRPGTPAEKSGLKAGDLITMVDNKPVANLDAYDAVAKRPPGASLTMTIVRDGRTQSLPVTLGTRPAAASAADQPPGEAPGALTLSPPGPSPSGGAPLLAPPTGPSSPATLPPPGPSEGSTRGPGIVAQPQNPTPPASDTQPGPGSSAGSGGASLGVTLPPPGSTAGVRTQRGAMIAGVKPGSPAALAGLKPGQMIVRIDTKSIDSDDDLISAIRARQPGQSVELLYRDESGEVRKTTVKLAQAGAAAPPNSSGGFSAPGAGGGIGGSAPPASATPQGSPFRFGPGGGSRPLLDQIERVADNFARPASTVYDPLAFAALQRRVEELEGRIKSLESKLGGASSTAPAPSGTSTTPGFGTAAPPVTPGFGPALGGTGTTP